VSGGVGVAISGGGVGVLVVWCGVYCGGCIGINLRKLFYTNQSRK
jgi:hypothetical protein